MKMDDSINIFLDELKLKLSGFPEDETREAVEYYEEYINDALDEGKSAEELLSHLDSPEKIATMIKAETSIKKAQSNPGLKNYSKVLKYARYGITKPISVLLFSIFIIVTYSTAVLLFCGAIVSAAAACVILPGFIYEALKIPSKYIAEIISTISMGIFSAGLCLLLAFGFFKLCRLFIQLSSGLVRRMLNKSHKPLTDISKSPAEKSNSSKLLLKVCLISISAGLVLSLATGLPIKLFMIFNSMEPSSIATQEWEYDSTSVDKINITTAHSHIRLEKGDSDKIKISYEQSDWLEPETTCTNGQLTFSEKFNGRLPLFSFVSLHENNTEVVISLPEGFKPDALGLESKGGFVHIGSTDFNVMAKTYTGNIYLEPGTGAKPAVIRASTSTGIIQAGGTNVGAKTSKSTEYIVAAQTGSSIELDTTRGSIFIK